MPSEKLVSHTKGSSKKLTSKTFIMHPETPVLFERCSRFRDHDSFATSELLHLTVQPALDGAFAHVSSNPDCDKRHRSRHGTYVVFLPYAFCSNISASFCRCSRRNAYRICSRSAFWWTLFLHTPQVRLSAGLCDR